MAPLLYLLFVFIKSYAKLHDLLQHAMLCNPHGLSAPSFTRVRRQEDVILDAFIVLQLLVPISEKGMCDHNVFKFWPHRPRYWTRGVVNADSNQP